MDEDNRIDACLRGSRVREDLLIAASELKKTSLSLLAERAGVSPHVARMAIEGNKPWYSVDHSLQACRLLELLDIGRFTECRVTELGRVEARRVLALRRAAARRELANQRAQHGQRRSRRGRQGVRF